MNYREHIAKQKKEIETRLAAEIATAVNSLADKMDDPRVKGYGPTPDGQGFVVNFQDGLGYEIAWKLHHGPAPFQIGQRVRRTNADWDKNVYTVTRFQEAGGESNPHWVIWSEIPGVEGSEFGCGDMYLEEVPE
jgi:hypothetical protein